MPTYFTPIETKARLQAAVINLRLTELDNALRQIGTQQNVYDPVYLHDMPTDGTSDAFTSVMDTVEDAHDAGGGAVFLRLGTFMLSDSIDLRNYTSVQVYGAGRGQRLPLGQGTIIRPTGNFPAFLVGGSSGIEVNKSPVHHWIHNLQIYGSNNPAFTNQHGIVFEGQESPANQCAFNVAERLIIWRMGGDAIRFQDNAWTNTCRNIQINECHGNGITALDEANTNLIQSVQIGSCVGHGLYFEADPLRGIYGFDMVNVESTANGGYGAYIANAQVRNVTMSHCYFENNELGALYNDGNSTAVFGGRFMQQSPNVDAANVDLVRWLGKYGGMWGTWMQGDCRYMINLDDSLNATFMGIGTDVNAAFAGFLDYYSVTGASLYTLNNQNNRLSVPALQAIGASSVAISATDTTNGVTVRMIPGDAEAAIGTSTDDNLYLETNATRRVTLDTGGAVMIGQATVPGQMTQGLAINMGTNTNGILALLADDVNQPATNIADAKAFAHLAKFGATTGGLSITGLDESATVGVRIRGAAPTPSSSRGTGQVAAVVIDGSEMSGAGLATLGADMNILAVRDNGTARFFLDSDGNSHQDVSTAWTEFDAFDDMYLLNLLNAHVARDPLRAALNEWLQEKRDLLEHIKLVQFNDDGHHFVNMSRLTMLLVGAVRQQGAQLAELRRRLLSA